MPKRTENVSLRVSPEDLELFKQAAQKLWPGATLTQTSIILDLARLHAEAVLKRRR